jgi:hypothetical protein
MPMSQVTAMKDWKSGEIFECGSDKIIVFFDPADGRVRITSWKDWVVKVFLHPTANPLQLLL